MQIGDLSATELVDLLHYYFELDSYDVSSAEQAEARDAVRIGIYRNLYDMTYNYASKSSKNKYAGGVDIPPEDTYGEVPTPVDPFEKAKVTKAYVPATRIDADSARPLGLDFDAPLN